MNYSELLQIVLSMTSRPDLVKENRTAISGAIRKFHLAETFQRDLRITRINLATIPTSNFTWQIGTKSSLFERFRKLYYVKPVKQDYLVTLNNLPSIRDQTWETVDTVPIKDPADLFDEVGMALSNYIFLAGDSLTLRLANINTILDIFYHQHPLIEIQPEGGLNFQSWIVDDMPEAVATEAAAVIFKIIGKDEEFTRHRAMFDENLSLLKINNIYNN